MQFYDITKPAKELIAKDIKDICSHVFCNPDLLTCDELFFHIALNQEGVDFLTENLDRFCLECKDLDKLIMLYMSSFRYDINFIKRLALSSNIEVREATIIYISENRKSLMRDVYDNIIEAFAITNDEGNILARISEKTLSKAAANLLDVRFDKELFNEIKEYIYANYKRNHLLDYIYHIDPDNDTNDLFHVYEVIKSDIRRLFETSINYKLEFLLEHEELVPVDLATKITSAIAPFLGDKHTIMLERDVIREIFFLGLGDDFIRLVHKYYGISSSSVIGPNNNGTKTYTFSVGDFIIKYITGYYNILGNVDSCPRFFEINKKVEEVIAYNDNGSFAAALQVQQRLLEPLKEDQTDIISKFIYELEKNGYFYSDHLVGEGRENVFRLFDYHDADCDNPEDLPEWFKQYPYVLVDRDCVYPIEMKPHIEDIQKLTLERLKEDYEN